MAATQVLNRSSLGLTALVGEREEGEGERAQLHVHYGVHRPPCVRISGQHKYSKYKEWMVLFKVNNTTNSVTYQMNPAMCKQDLSFFTN